MSCCDKQVYESVFSQWQPVKKLQTSAKVTELNIKEVRNKVTSIVTSLIVIEMFFEYFDITQRVA